MTNNSKDWEGDVLHRKKYSVFLTKHLESKKESFVININAPWGAGKTFFLENWFEDVKLNHPAIFFNAWKNDHSDDPLIAIISCINKSISQLLVDDNHKSHSKDFLEKSGKFLKKFIPVLVKATAYKLLGENGAEALSEINSEDEKSLADISSKFFEELLKDHERTSTSIDEFKTAVSDLIKDVVESSPTLNQPLFVFIDELDRCRPLYSIELLEKVKHIFDIPNVVFVVATDTQQLSHSVKAIYGEGFDGETYLRRFFDQIYTLPKPDYIEFATLLFKSYEPKTEYFQYKIVKSKAEVHSNHRELINEHTLFCDSTNTNGEMILLFSLFAAFFGLDLRTMKQCFDRFTAIENSSSNKELIHFGYLIFLIMFEANNSQKFNTFFDSSKRNKRNDISQGFRQSKENVIISIKQYIAIDFLNIYIKLTECTDKDLKKLLTSPGAGSNDYLEFELTKKLFENFGALNNYIELVKMAEALN